MLLKVVTDIFQEVGKDVGPFGEKKIFWKIFSQRGPLQLLTLPFGQHRGQIFFPKSFFYSLVMWRALKSGYGYFPSGRIYGPFGEKKIQRGPLQLLTLPFGQHRGQIFFPKSFFYSLVMWRALKSGYGHFPRGREGYRTIWRKKNIFTFFFPPFSLPRHPGSRFGPDNVGSL